MAGRIRPDARSFPCICCDRRSTAGPLRSDEILKNAFSKVLLLHNVPSPHWQRAFPYGTSRFGGISLGGNSRKNHGFSPTRNVRFRSEERRVGKECGLWV